MPKDMRTFIEDVVRERPGDILRVAEEIDPTFGATAVAARLEREQRFEAVFFERIEGSKLPAIINLTATYERLALALGTTVKRMVQDYGERQRRPMPFQWVDRKDAPVKEVVLTGEEARLTALPILTHNALDAGPYITGGVLICKDPDTGLQNAGLYRHQLQAPDQLGVWFWLNHHGNYIKERYDELDREMEVAIAIGHHPAFVMGAVSRVPGIGREFEEAGALLGEPLEVIKAETVDLLVPARAEIIVEGVIPPRQTVDEGPFAEWPGHYVEDGKKPFIKVKCMTMRHDAIYYDVFASHREHTVLGSLPRMGSIYRRVKEVVPGLVNVNVPAYSRMHCILSIKKRNDNEVKKAAFAALLTEPENLHLIIVVDHDIDPFNHGEVMWAIGTRFHADRGLHVIKDWMGPGGLNPITWQYHEDGTKSRRMVPAVIIDATMPSPPASYPPRAIVPKDAVDAVDLNKILQPFTGLRAPTKV